MFQARRDPIKIVISVKELFGVKICCQSYATQTKVSFNETIEGEE